MISGASLGAEAMFDCDVVVIGSGGGGAPATYELARAGLTVICLEAGPLVKPEDFTQRKLETIQRVYVDRGAQGTADGSLQLLQGRCVGGSTVINGEVCFRTPDAVLEEWSTRYFVGGMSPTDMAPVFDEVERMINVTVNEGRYLDAGTRPAEGLRALGIDPKPISRNVKDCRGCCYCFFGCAYGCKQSMDQSYLPAALRASARVIHDAEVERLERDGNRVTGVVARTPAGTLRIASRAVVLACGAVQTPLILLDHGIGGDQVGHHLAVHPVLFATGLHDEDKPARVSTMLATYSDHWVDEGFLVELGSGSNAFAAQGAPGIGRAHKELARQAQKLWSGGAVVRDLAA
ncbi:MAG TPA: GMC family oxidoreductase N-terminal domain-containing protein, partial [Kofleriaceae bacterium]|nr:GMC family oxidoreductase N-terminal domain-containing protein [Kofleriaceae bacterium]